MRIDFCLLDEDEAPAPYLREPVQIYVLDKMMAHPNGQTISALIAYRNGMFHNGLEWPIKEGEKFKRRIEEEWPSDWFIIGTSGENPWLFYMSETFIQHVLSSIEQALRILGQFVADNWQDE